MARFVDPTGTKFWNIERDGLFIVRRSGPVGKRGQSQRTPYVTRLLARFHHKQLVAQKLREGYRPVDDAPRDDDDFPFDSDARLVQGDLLQQKGDPLGELIALQHAGLDTSALIATHASTWFGDLAEVRDVVQLEWRLGRLERATIAYDRHTRGDWIRKVNSELLNVPYADRMATLLEALLDLPIARSLGELVVGIAESTDYRVTVRALNEHAPPTLRRLEIDSDARNYPTSAQLSPIELPQLEEFRSDLNFPALALEHVGSAPWPKLHTLVFAMHGSHEYSPPLSAHDAAAAVAALPPIFAIPSLRHLEISTPRPSLVARALIAANPKQLVDVVIKSKQPIELDLVLPPFARFEQQPAYTMRR